MRRYNIGDNVACIETDKDGNNHMTCNLVIKRIVKPNESFTEQGIGQNKTDKTFIIARDKDGNELWFEENKALPMLKVNKKAYDKLESIYRKELTKVITSQLAYLNPNSESHRISIEEFYNEGLWGRICKYCTPKDYPANFSFNSFFVNKKGHICIDAEDIDSDGEWTFDEDDLEIDELELINSLLEEVIEAVDSGEWTIDENYNLVKND